MLGRAKRVKNVGPTEVVIRPQPTPRDPGKRRPEPTVAAGSAKIRKASRIRRSQSIRAYVGSNGSGKSACAVYDLMPSLNRGRYVLSTVPILDWLADPADDPAFEFDPDLGVYLHRESGVAWERPTHPFYLRLTEFSQIMEADRCDVLLDEVAGVASSRQSQGMPAAIERLLQKLRKADITLSWTAPAWARADLIIRETTQAVTVCEGFRPKWEEGADGRLWPSNRLSEWSTYDSKAYTDWSEGKREKAKKLAFQRFHGPGSDAWNAYSTLGGVDMITAVTDAGKCVNCGGTRAAPKCTCPEYLDRLDTAKRVEHQHKARVTIDGIGGAHHEHAH